MKKKIAFGVLAVLAVVAIGFGIFAAQTEDEYGSVMCVPWFTREGETEMRPSDFQYAGHPNTNITRYTWADILEQHDGKEGYVINDDGELQWGKTVCNVGPFDPDYPRYGQN